MRLKRKIHAQLGKHPLLFYSAYRLMGKKRTLVVGRNTQLVIEGFPRSGNTFAVKAFEFAQVMPVRIAHHLHVPAQVIRAAEYKVPCLVLIRNPIDAIASLIIREAAVSIDAALDEYTCFYEKVYPFRKYFVLEEFNVIISDFAIALRKVNRKFGTEFLMFNHSPENVQKVFKMLDGLEYAKDKGCVEEDKVARPSDLRKSLKMQLRHDIELPRYVEKLKRAQKIYGQLLATL